MPEGGSILSNKRNRCRKKYYDILVSGGTKDKVIVYEMLKFIPDDFSGKLLELPASGLNLVCNKYAHLKNAAITCLDDSSESLEELQNKLTEHNISNVATVSGNFDQPLEFEDNSFDIVFSINGFDTFPNKDRAINQTLRVLKKGGMLIASFYVKGNSKLTDFKVQHKLVSKGMLTPPFYTAVSVQTTFGEIYEIKHFHTRGSVVYFCAVKK